ncbi:MAG: RDD family protein [Anaerolineae bacterium]
MGKASITSRAIAIFIDTFLIGIVTGIFAGIIGRVDLGGVGGFILTVAYNGFFWTRYNGQTPGKMLMHLRVVKVNGAELTWADAVVRCLGYVINTAIALIGWIWAAIDADGRGWHDLLAGTQVVNA